MSVLKTLRRRYVTPKILAWFQKSLPPINETEREALEAGDTSWEKELFCGTPDWQKLQVMPKAILSGPEESYLNQQVETLCDMLDDWDIVKQYQDLPPHIWDYLKTEGFFGLQIPQEYGGHGFSVWAHSHIITKIASRSVSAAITVMVPNALGPAELLQHFGTPEQKQYYLPRLAKGEEISAFALTELEAGSDATAISSTGVVCRDIYEGKEIIGIRLNWDKRYITLAPVATLLGLAFKLYDPEQLLGPQEKIGITLALVPTKLPGVVTGARHCPAGLGFLNGPTQGHDVFIPLDFIMGGPTMRGKGWQMIMDGLARGRGVSLPALSAAGAKLCYRMSGAYSRLREQFHLPIGQFQGVAEALGHIGGLTYLIEATRHFTLSAIAEGFKPALGSAISKYHLTEMERIVVNHAMDIHGGHGVQLGPKNYLGLLYQSLPVNITVEGANILTRNLIIFGQGALRCHPFIQQEIKATQLADPVQRLQVFDTLFFQHLIYSLRRFLSAFWQGFTGGFLIRAPHNRGLKKYYRQLTRMSNALALVSDIAFLLLGKTLKSKEAISARLGDVLSQLYMASAVIQYYQSQNKREEDFVFVQWSLERCLYQIQNAFDQALANFKPSGLGWMIRRLLFPWGRAYGYPKDSMTQIIAANMMKTSEQRDRITEHCYIGKNEDDATGRIELALIALEKLSANPQNQDEFLGLRQKALDVDKFLRARQTR